MSVQRLLVILLGGTVLTVIGLGLAAEPRGSGSGLSQGAGSWAVVQPLAVTEPTTAPKPSLAPAPTVPVTAPASSLAPLVDAAPLPAPSIPLWSRDMQQTSSSADQQSAEVGLILVAQNGAAPGGTRIPDPDDLNSESLPAPGAINAPPVGGGLGPAASDPPSKAGTPPSEAGTQTGGPAGLFAPPPPTEQLPTPNQPPIDSGARQNASGQDASSAGDTDDLLSSEGVTTPFPAPPLSTGPPTPPAAVAPHSLPSHAIPPQTSAKDGGDKKEGEAKDQKDPHADVYAKNLYPSAQECRVCHEQIYEEWAMSSHAYAAVSPMFHKFEQTITDLSKGTIGYFCMRCHSPVGTTIGHPREQSIWDAIPAAREGITCIVCHRVSINYTKADGERRIEPGTVYDPVYGAGYGQELANVLQKKDHYKVKLSAEEKGPGQPIHTGVIHFEQIKTSHACSSCHQVAVEPGIKLEVVWEQYRASPACKLGIQCQDCHMGKEPGLPIGYDIGPVAIVNEKKIDPQRKHSNHTFYGPGYSILHPGLFPINPKSEAWKPEEWLQFDYRAGWGTEQFEKMVKDQQLRVAFPKVWENSDERMDAREVLDANLRKLVQKAKTRRRLMENTSRVEGPVFECSPAAGRDLNVQYLVRNLNNGHNMPSGSLGAQPQIWLNVVLTGPHGNRVWESGYVDRNGDIADLHSLEVAAGRIVADQQLVNFQTKFLITHVKGPDREMYLPINTDFDQLPFLRPSPFPVKVLNHPPFIRMEAHSLTPNGARPANYVIPGSALSEPGVYRLSVRMRFRPEPIYFMRFCGATPEMERTMNEWMLDFNESSMQFVVQ